MTSLTDIAHQIMKRKGSEDAVANLLTRSQAQALIDEAVLAEREACAEICEDCSDHIVGNDLAAAIRARGEK